MIDVAETELAGRDPVLADLIARNGPCVLVGRRSRGGSHFESLAEAIVYQQLAGRAAAAIWARVRDLVPGRFTAEALLAVPHADLRGAGLSEAKARSLVDLATHVSSGDLRLDRISRLADDEVVASLSRVRGIGRWTAEMFLLFRLGRLDVWPTGDLGVRKGFARAWGLPAEPTPKELEALGEPFRPWRSVVAWHCWRVADTPLPAA